MTTYMNGLTSNEDVNLKVFPSKKEDVFDLNRIFSIRLSNTKELALFEENCDNYYITVLDQSSFQTLINELQSIANTMKPLPELTREHKIGDYVSWKTIGGNSFVGRIKEWDSNVAIITMPDRSTKSVEC